MRGTYDSIGKWIAAIDRCSQMYITRNLREYGVGPSQLSVLMTLYRKDGVSQEWLSKALFLDKANITRALQALEDIGLVKRLACESDRRKNLVYLTEKGAELEETIIQSIDVWTDTLAQNLSKDERTQLLQLLKTVAGNATNYFTEKQSDEY